LLYIYSSAGLLVEWKIVKVDSNKKTIQLGAKPHTFIKNLKTLLEKVLNDFTR